MPRLASEGLVILTKDAKFVSLMECELSLPAPMHQIFPLLYGPFPSYMEMLQLCFLVQLLLLQERLRCMLYLFLISGLSCCLSSALSCIY